MDPEAQQNNYASNGKLMLCFTILFFLVVIVVVFLHTCRHSCFHRRRATRTDSSVAFNKGLRSSVLKFLPTFTYSSDTHRSLHDCAVCLSEFGDGEEGRILPNCNHAFHSHCIDAWFRSRSNCPLGRTPVRPPRTIEPGPFRFSSFPALIACPRKSLELVDIIVDSGRGPRISRVG